MKLDEMVDEAWREFRAALADAVDDASSPLLKVSVGDGTSASVGAPYVALAVDGETLRLAVPGNRRLAEEHHLDQQARRRLRALGLRKVRGMAPGNRVSTFGRDQVEQAASVATSVLRDVFGVLHPAFLVSDDVHWGLAQVPVEIVPEAQAPAAVYPKDQEHLDELIEAAIEEVAEHPPFRDDDGDLAIVHGSSVIYVHSARQEPLIRIFAVMVLGIADVDAADREVAELNRDVDGVKFERRDDQIIASMDLIAYPFAAQHLQMLTAHVITVVTKRDAEVAERVGGRVFLDSRNLEESDLDVPAVVGPHDSCPEVDHHGRHPVMERLQQIETDQPGSLRPKVAARLCGDDPALVSELLELGKSEAGAWRTLRDEAVEAGDAMEAAECEHLRVHAARTVQVLRTALQMLTGDDSRNNS